MQVSERTTARAPGATARAIAVLLAVTLLAANSNAQPPAAGHGAVIDSSRVARLIAAALERTEHVVRYDGAYRSIPYPAGDVPDSIGVCTDLIIRSYRAIDIDLQQLVHEDMTAHFDQYPDRWGLTRPDTNIDHRRVPNLQTFFARHGTELPRSRDGADYAPGELVTWVLPGNLPHIGLVIDRAAPGGGRPLIVHNIGRGPEVADVLFAFPITGRYRYAIAAGSPDPR